MKKKILIVDDEKDILELVSIMLSDKGDIVVYKAENGLNALEIARKEKPDLILLDIMMPEIDGWEVLKMLKIDEVTKDIPVVMLTCKTETRDKVIGIQEGAVDYITKPFAPDDLITKVGEILKKEGEED